MKSFVYLLLFLSSSIFAFAQEESASPAEKSNDPTVSVTTEKTVSPTPKPTASASPTKSSSPAAKSSPSPKSSPAESATASPSSSASMPAKKSTAEATIREIEDKWEAGVKNHDSSVPQAYLADDFRGVSSKGEIVDKKKLLSEIKKDTDAYAATKNGKIDVRVFGGQFAVATGVSST